MRVTESSSEGADIFTDISGYAGTLYPQDVHRKIRNLLAE
jgi:hypothetical protein